MIADLRTAVGPSATSLDLVAFAEEMAEIIGRLAGAKPDVVTTRKGPADDSGRRETTTIEARRP